MFTHPAFDKRVDLGHGVRDVRMTITAAEFHRRVGRDAKMRAFQAFDARRHHRAVESQRQLGQGRRGHGVAAEKGRRDAVVHLLVDQHAQVLAVLERAQQQASTGWPLGDQGTLDGGASAAIEPFHEAVVGRPVDPV